MFCKPRFSTAVFGIGCLTFSLSLGLRADLKYEERTQITGGMMEGLAKVAGFFGAKGLNDMLSTTYIKGDRLRQDSFQNNELVDSQIIRLDRDEIISIDHKKKNYSVMTFDQMRQQLEKAMESMKSQNKESKANPKDADVKFEPKVSIQDTGETKVINGFRSKHVVMSIQFEGEDQKTKDKGTFGADTDLWLTGDIPGFEEQRKFYQKYAQKLGSAMIKSAGTSPMAQDPRMIEAMQEMAKQAEKMEGVPVLTIASFNIGAAPAGGSQSQASSSASSSKADREESQDPDVVNKSLGKVLGGLGGFGRKKKAEPTARDSASSQTTSSSSSGQTSSASASLMKTTTELKSASNASLDANLFEVPSGYKLSQK